jgi:transcriptional regulator with XRE-family HTH domain
MRTHDDPEIIAIGNRIRDAAIARGYTSSQSASGVKISILARMIGASSEMTRRYVEGSASIPVEKIRLLAKGLQVSLLWLSHGQGQMENEIVDSQILEECLDLVYEAEEKSGTRMSNSSKSKLVADLYKQRINGLQNPAEILAAAFRISQSPKK